MLTPAYLMDVPEMLVDIWAQLEQDIVGDISRRLVKTKSITASAVGKSRSYAICG
jgi:hypothetical protein